MNVGGMKNYKRRDLRASHTLGWSYECKPRLKKNKKGNERPVENAKCVDDGGAGDNGGLASEFCITGMPA
jgi:hypothetical protein